MKNADRAGCRRRFRKHGGYLDSWDKVVGWVLLLAFVLGGTQVLLAQHIQTEEVTRARQAKSQGTPLHDESPESGQERKHWSAEPGCFAQMSDVPDRTFSRSWTLASPDGVYKAYAVNEAVAEHLGGGSITGCKSTSKLIVSGPGPGEARTVLTVGPTADVAANSIEIVDWSPNGHRLLLNEGMWIWASDTGGNVAHVYDADSMNESKGDSFIEPFVKIFGQYCVGNFDAIGFSRNGKVVVRWFPDNGEDGTFPQGSCVKKKEIWELDLTTTKVNRLPDDYKVLRYGKQVIERSN